MPGLSHVSVPMMLLGLIVSIMLDISSFLVFMLWKLILMILSLFFFIFCLFLPLSNFGDELVINGPGLCDESSRREKIFV